MEQAVHGKNGVKGIGREIQRAEIHLVRCQAIGATVLDHLRRQICAHNLQALLGKEGTVNPRAGADLQQARAPTVAATAVESRHGQEPSMERLLCLLVRLLWRRRQRAGHPTVQASSLI